jgi:hypothetical protein
MSWYTGDLKVSSGFAGKSSVTRGRISGRFLLLARIPRQGERTLTIRQLIQLQRQWLRSSNPVERFAAALLIPAELKRQLRMLRDFEIGQLLENEVWSNLNLLSPDATICMEAVDRLRQHHRQKRTIKE